MARSSIAFNFDNSYARELAGCYQAWEPEPVAKPKLLYFNHPLARNLRLNLAGWDETVLAQCFCGNQLPSDATPIAQVYAGHQFGQFSPQLGDGRALVIGEVIDAQGLRQDLAFKGSGRTPFSRGGDGKAAIGPMLREVLLGEAMAALGVPTTRALAVVATGEPVRREQLLPGAVLTRTAQSHIRVGTFEYFAARGDQERIRKLAEYSIARHYPNAVEQENRFLALLQGVVHNQAKLIARWMNLGFIHGVMNTDNMAISGETIDYGPCAFMEAYDPKTVFSSIDHSGRYAYANQPRIAQWNLARFAETLVPQLANDQETAIALATEAINEFPELYQRYWLEGIRQKLGLEDSPTAIQADLALTQDWLELLKNNQVDFTLAWRTLADAAEGIELPLRKLFADQAALENWLDRWQNRCHTENQLSTEPGQLRADAMRRVSPIIIPRNHHVEAALTAASEQNDLAPFQHLLRLLQQPYDTSATDTEYAQPAEKSFTRNYQTFCGT